MPADAMLRFNWWELRNSLNRPYVSSTHTTGDFVLPFDLGYEVDFWGRIGRTITASGEEAQATAADLETARLSRHDELAIDYFELRAADAQQKLLDDTVNAYAEALHVTHNRVAGGGAPESDEAEVQTQLQTTHVQATTSPRSARNSSTRSRCRSASRLPPLT